MKQPSNSRAACNQSNSSRISHFPFEKLLELIFVVYMCGAATLVSAQPKNQDCDGADFFICGGSLLVEFGDDVLANDSDPFPNHEGEEANNLPDVWYRFALQERMSVNLNLRELNLGGDEALAVLIKTTSTGGFCNPANLKPENFIGATHLPFNQPLQTKCLDPGPYLILVEGIDLGEFPRFVLEHDCEKWVDPPAPEEGSSSDGDGGDKSFFEPRSRVYLSGTGLSPGTTTSIRIVADRVWQDKDPIGEVVPGAATWVKTNDVGSISGSNVETPDGVPLFPTDSTPHSACVWADPVPGMYDVVFDNNSNGIYDEGVDGLDDNDAGTAGFVVLTTIEIPTLGKQNLIVLAILLLVTAGIFIAFRRGV